MAAPRNAPITCATVYGSTFFHGKPRNSASAKVTAGLACVPETDAVA